MPTEKEKCGKHECECQKETCSCKQQEEDKTPFDMGFDDGYSLGQFEFLEAIQDILNMNGDELIDCFGPLFPTVERVLLDMPADVIMLKLQEWYEKKKQEEDIRMPNPKDEWAAEYLTSGLLDTVKLGTIHLQEALRDIGYQLDSLEFSYDIENGIKSKVKYSTL